nr:HAD family hydrolase [Actinomycetota bacterium]
MTGNTDGGRAGGVAGVIFDWGGTITPWHSVDLDEQWRVFAREFHLDEQDPALVDDLARRIWAAESAGWLRGRHDGASARIEEILAEAGIVADDPRAVAGQQAYHEFWEPHTWTDPQIRPLWEGLHDKGIRVGVLSNTIWSRDYHRGLFARDGVLDLV